MLIVLWACHRLDTVVHHTVPAPHHNQPIIECVCFVIVLLVGVGTLGRGMSPGESLNFSGISIIYSGRSIIYSGKSIISSVKSHVCDEDPSAYVPAFVIQHSSFRIQHS